MAEAIHYSHNGRVPWCGVAVGEVRSDYSAVTCGRCRRKLKRQGPIEALTLERDEWKARTVAMRNTVDVATQLVGVVQDSTVDERAISEIRNGLLEARRDLITIGESVQRLAASVTRRLDDLEVLAARLVARPLLVNVPPAYAQAVAETMVPGSLGPLTARLVRLSVSSTGLPQRCVYFLIAGVRVVYVGQTIAGAFSRLSQHTREKNFDSVLLLPLPNAGAEELTNIEGALIRWLRPELNSAGLGVLTAADREILADLGFTMEAAPQ